MNPLVILAPMAGATDSVFRGLVKEQGCDLVVSEMVSAQALIHSNARTYKLIRFTEKERPIAVQLFGHDARVMADAAQLVIEHCQPDMIDINLGCPTPKIVKNGDGAALARDPEEAAKVVQAVVERATVPVTAKIRLGWDDSHINCVELAKRLEQCGVHWLTVHARTRQQFYAGEANWQWIGEIVKAVQIPVVGNGDIFSPEDAKRILNETGCSHIMIGRGSLGNPWIFRQIKAYLETGKLIPGPSLEERISTALRHLSLVIDENGEPQGVKAMRSHLAWYLKGVRNSSAIRAKLNTAETFAEVERELMRLLAER